MKHSALIWVHYVQQFVLKSPVERYGRILKVSFANFVLLKKIPVKMFVGFFYCSKNQNCKFFFTHCAERYGEGFPLDY